MSPEEPHHQSHQVFHILLKFEFTRQASHILSALNNLYASKIKCLIKDISRQNFTKFQARSVRSGILDRTRAGLREKTFYANMTCVSVKLKKASNLPDITIQHDRPWFTNIYLVQWNAKASPIGYTHGFPSIYRYSLGRSGRRFLKIGRSFVHPVHTK